MKTLITAVIPTRNRPQDLVKAVESVLIQSRQPDEFMIVDQSPGNESRHQVEVVLARHPNVRTNYIHDSKIAGLVAAKKVATERALGDIICFLEDDIILQPDYLEQIEKGFGKLPEMLGTSGIITNMPEQSFAYDFIFQLFHKGIFKDPRLEVYGRFKNFQDTAELVLSDKISGGTSAWKKTVFESVSFDSSNGFFMLEDIDFSTRVTKHFGPCLYINPNARLEHHFSPVNRDVMAVRQERKMVEIITFYKRRREWSGATLSLAWLLIGLFLESTFKSFRQKSLAPLKSYFRGTWKGFKKP